MENVAECFGAREKLRKKTITTVTLEQVCASMQSGKKKYLLGCSSYKLRNVITAADCFNCSGKRSRVWKCNDAAAATVRWQTRGTGGIIKKNNMISVAEIESGVKKRVEQHLAWVTCTVLSSFVLRIFSSWKILSGRKEMSHATMFVSALTATPLLHRAWNSIKHYCFFFCRRMTWNKI